KDAGTGESYLFPRLAGSALVQSDDPATLAHVVLHGTRAVSTASRRQPLPCPRSLGGSTIPRWPPSSHTSGTVGETPRRPYPPTQLQASAHHCPRRPNSPIQPNALVYICFGPMLSKSRPVASSSNYGIQAESFLNRYCAL